MGRYLKLAMTVVSGCEPTESPVPVVGERIGLPELTGESESGVPRPKIQKLAPCGSPTCAGCYEVGDGRKIHPPRCGEEFLRWRAWMEGKGKKH